MATHASIYDGDIKAQDPFNNMLLNLTQTFAGNKNKMSLLNLLETAGQYRHVAGSTITWHGPTILFCLASELKPAITAFAHKYGAQPLYVCFYDGPGEHRFLDSAAIRDVTELIQESGAALWCYGKGERRKGLRLAAAGVRDFFFAEDPGYGQYRNDPQYWEKFGSELQTVFDLLNDEESRLTLASIIKSRISKNHGFLRIATYREYFHPVVGAQTGDWVIDAGAFDGATSLAFAKASRNGKIFAFEPDPNNLIKINSAIASISKQGTATAPIQIAPFALSDKEEKLYFKSGKNGSSALAKQAEDTIAVNAITLDAYVAANALERVDLISIDIEGAEAAALEGMRDTIRKFRPKLQVSIYHKPEDLFRLPLMVAEMTEDYVYFLGHHNTYSTETDLYAIPVEKMPAQQDGGPFAPRLQLQAYPLKSLIKSRGSHRVLAVIAAFFGFGKKKSMKKQ